ncbi:MAG TPA: protein kinase [Polyangiaceae bacterium]|jgi:serine/threonine protein kinase|nr:protein kinase [Polyangiaceae bacterium]
MMRSPAPAESDTPLAEGPLRAGAGFLDKYEICEQIGHGGQAWVYRGQHIFTGREVAIKVMDSPNGMTREMRMRGESEARALGKLDHPNIVVMHDAGVTDEGLFYIVMELLRGRSLRGVLAEHRRLGVEEVLRLGAQAGEALQVAHEAGLIHRDLKPDNIYITRDNRLKVLDFGIAKMLNEIGFTTRKDIVVGSVLYMSPEQVQGLPVNAQSDICALGLMMFEALLGKHPSLLVFEHDLSERNEPCRRAALADIPPIQVNRMPPLLSELDPDIPIHVAELVQRAMAKVATDRFATMPEFVSATRVCLEAVRRSAQGKRSVAAERDLSLPIPRGLSEPPVSQRATPKWGVVWEGAREPIPPDGPTARMPAPIELLEAERETRPITAAPSGNRSASGLTVRVAPARRSRSTPVKNAIVAGCLLGAALSSAFSLMYLRGTVAASPARVEPAATSQNSLMASLSPATPFNAADPARAPEPEPSVVDIAPGVSSPAPHESALPNASSTPRAAAVPSSNTPPDRTRPPASIRAGSRSKPPTSIVRADRTKRINGGKLIYGGD